MRRARAHRVTTVMVCTHVRRGVCGSTHPASLLKVDQSTLRRTQRARCQTLNVTDQRLPGQTALGGPLHKWFVRIPHALTVTQPPVSDGGYSQICTVVQTRRHTRSNIETHTSASRHTYSQQVLRIFFYFFLPLLGQAGLYPTWLGR